MTWNFGTDGMRGIFSPHVLPQIYAIAAALCSFSQERLHAVIGWDARTSSISMATWIKNAIEDHGGTVTCIGAVTTPCLAWVTKNNREYGVGIMISASHNGPEYNGLKLFNGDGDKMPLPYEQRIVECARSIESPSYFFSQKPIPIDYSLLQAYENSLFCRDLKGLKVVIDCAHGAVAHNAYAVFTRNNAHVCAVLGDSPTGENINQKCGALYPEGLQKAVMTHKADVGFAFDGDADRVIVVDSKGKVHNGDQILACLAPFFAGGVVGTVVSNGGLENYIQKLGKEWVRTAVGDRWIGQELQEKDWFLGGEACGHIIDRNHLTSSDGMHIALTLAEKMTEFNTDIIPCFTPLPSQSFAIDAARVSFKSSSTRNFLDHIAQKMAELPGGRFVCRPSGTEPCVRFLCEAAPEAELAMGDLVQCIKNFFGA